MIRSVSVLGGIDVLDWCLCKIRGDPPMPEVNDNPLRLIHLAVSHLAAALNSSSDETQKKQF